MDILWSQSHSLGKCSPSTSSSNLSYQISHFTRFSSRAFPLTIVQIHVEMTEMGSLTTKKVSFSNQSKTGWVFYHTSTHHEKSTKSSLSLRRRTFVQWSHSHSRFLFCPNPMTLPSTFDETTKKHTVLSRLIRRRINQKNPKNPKNDKCRIKRIFLSKKVNQKCRMSN